ncbi:MAG: RDD family protein [Wenzhouxiangella sp.]|nr:RDD family protein [Wenzhouxiangella sp.]MCH8477658.1 RDD family protein [Wenzhouxiangella sp.]
MEASSVDTRLAVETPDGIELDLIPAGPVLRAAAWLIDSVIRAGMLIGLGFVLSALGAAGIALLILAWFLINWWYPVLFEVLAGGATPGKKAFGLRVVNEDGTPVGWGASIVRNLLRQVDFLPFGYGAGLLAMHCNSRFQRLGDLAAATLVVYRDWSVTSARALPPGPAEPPPLPLAPAEQQILLTFAERGSALNPERIGELAGIMTPVTGLTGVDSAERLLAWARWLKGQAR